MAPDPTKVMQSLADKSELKQYTNLVRRNVFQEPEQVSFTDPCPAPRITEEKLFRCNITDSALQVYKVQENFPNYEELGDCLCITYTVGDTGPEREILSQQEVPLASGRHL